MPLFRLVLRSDQPTQFVITIAVTLLDPPFRAPYIIYILDTKFRYRSLFHFCMRYFFYIILIISFFVLFIIFRAVQELGGGVVFPCGSNSALVVPVRHVRYSLY